MKIGELAIATASNVETVRYYEKIGLLPPPARTSSNYRAYGSEHLARLSFIRRARDLGFTLEAVRELLTLSDDKAQSCEAVDGIARTHLTEIDHLNGAVVRQAELAGRPAPVNALLTALVHEVEISREFLKPAQVMARFDQLTATSH